MKRPKLNPECRVSDTALRLLNPQAIHVFTDGSCSRKNGSGGWGAVLRFKTAQRRAHGGWPHKCTIGAMELTAILEGLSLVKDWTRKVIVYTDSQYAANALSMWWRGWERNEWMTAGGLPVANRELIEAILALTKNHVVAFKWVKGHAGHPLNELADELAGTARRAALETLTPVRNVFDVEDVEPMEAPA